MKKILYILLLLLLTSPMFSQTGSKIDSLEGLLLTKNQGKKLIVLNELAQEYLKPSSLDKANEYANNALLISKNIKNETEEAKAYKTIGSIYYYKKDYKTALNNYSKSFELKNKLGDKEGSAALLYNIGIIYKNEGSYKKAIQNYEKSLHIYEELQDTINVASTYQVIGISYFYWARFEKAVDYYQKSLAIYKKLDDKKGIANCLQKIGVIYHEWGDFEQALKFNRDALKIFEKIDDKYSIANTIMNIGIVFKDWGNYQIKALEYLDNALVLMEEIGNKQGVAYALNNTGTVYEEWDNYDEIEGNKEGENYKMAIEYFEKALEIEEEIGDKHGYAGTLQSIGNVYGKWEFFSKSLEYHQKSFKIRNEIGDKAGVANSQHCIGLVFREMENYPNALNYLNNALEIAMELKMKDLMENIYKSMSGVYYSKGDFKNAFDYYCKYSEMKDSIFNIESHKQIAEMEEKYEAEKKDHQIELLAKEKELQKLDLKKKEEENKRQRFFIYGSVLVLIIILIFSILLFSQLRQKKKANILLAAKNQEISDSIHYASRIQSAILPPIEYINEVLPEHFILDKPRDIVSGDFYWLARKEKKIIIAVADCTGHGVPGAFMSMLGVAFLNEIVNQYENVTANEILNKLRANVIKSLHQTGKEGEATDGMDISLCIIDANKSIIQYAGANNPLYIIRNNELIETKADKMPISIYVKDDVLFTNNEIKIENRDMIYMFTDGYIDQFGGEKGKKLKFKPFKELLLNINEKPTDEQKEILVRKFEEWQGSYDQIDDILIMGIRIA